jgi:hypothetical protein
LRRPNAIALLCTTISKFEGFLASVLGYILSKDATIKNKYRNLAQNMKHALFFTKLLYLVLKFNT